MLQCMWLQKVGPDWAIEQQPYMQKLLNIKKQNRNGKYACLTSTHLLKFVYRYQHFTKPQYSRC